MPKTYEGWKNRQTWNVAMWVNNDEWLYNAAVDYVKDCRLRGFEPTWYGYVRRFGLKDERTPDNISYSGARLDRKELNEMLRELV